MIPAGTTLEEIFINMLSQKASAKLEGNCRLLMMLNLVPRKAISLIQHIETVKALWNKLIMIITPNNKLFFRKKSVAQTTTRQLQSNYTQGETYFATVIYARVKMGRCPERID